MYVVKTTSTGYSGLQLFTSYIHDHWLQASVVSSVMMLDSNKVGWNGKNVIQQLCDEASNAEQCEAGSGNNVSWSVIVRTRSIVVTCISFI